MPQAETAPDSAKLDAASCRAAGCGVRCCRQNNNLGTRHGLHCSNFVSHSDWHIGVSHHQHPHHLCHYWCHCSHRAGRWHHCVAELVGAVGRGRVFHCRSAAASRYLPVGNHLIPLPACGAGHTVDENVKSSCCYNGGWASISSISTLTSSAAGMLRESGAPCPAQCEAKSWLPLSAAARCKALAAL